MELNNALRDAAQSGDAATYAKLLITHICYNDAAYALRSHELDRAQSHRHTWAKATDKGVSPDFAAKLTEELTKLADVAPVVVTDPAQPDPAVSAMIRGYEAGKRYARTHGCAAVWRADDSLRLFYMDKGKLRQKTWRHARPIEA